MTLINQQWLLTARPEGEIKAGDFTWHESPVPDLADGEFLVRNIYLSIDPTNRAWMAPKATYLPPIPIGGVIRGSALGIVEASNHPNFEVGQIVQGLLGWQKYAITNGEGIFPVTVYPGTPLDAYLSYFGMIGMTAYFGLLEIGDPKEGETLVVSAAAGAVGSIVCQIGKLKGLRVIGIAGTDEKCRYLTEDLGIDGAINYKTANMRQALKEHCPNGIDIYFENVGGPILEAVLSRINLRARIVMCGMISQYSSGTPVPGPSNLANLISRRGRMEGFIILDYFDRAHEANSALGKWLLEGKVKYRSDIAPSLEHAPESLQKLFTGRKNGKLLVQVSELPELG